LNKTDREVANARAVRGILLFLAGFVSLIILYLFPSLELNSPYWNVTIVQGGNLIWEIGLCGLSVGILGHATRTSRKKTPRLLGRMFHRIFWIRVSLAIALPVIVAMWNAAKNSLPLLNEHSS